jgi:hypothetical protein
MEHELLVLQFTPAAHKVLGRCIDTLALMAPLRLRHPGGVTTIQIDFDQSTVQDLQQEVYRATDILPSLQDRASMPLTGMRMVQLIE